MGIGKSIEDMSVAELEVFIAKLPDKSVCQRATISALKKTLLNKRIQEQANANSYKV